MFSQHFQSKKMPKIRLLHYLLGSYIRIQLLLFLAANKVRQPQYNLQVLRVSDKSIPFHFGT